jgi:hypothetical protein
MILASHRKPSIEINTVAAVSTAGSFYNHVTLGKEGERLRKSNIDGVNLIKVYYIMYVNITMKPLCTVIY